MHDQIAGIHQHPVAMRQTFHTRCVAGILASTDNAISNRANMRAGAAGSDNHVICDSGFAGKIDRYDLFGFRIIQTVEDDRDERTVILRRGGRSVRKRIRFRFRP